MTALQREAISMIQDVSEEKLYDILQIIKGVHGLEKSENAEKRERAFSVYAGLRRPAPALDYDRELSDYREGKYGTSKISVLTPSELLKLLDEKRATTSP